MNVLPGSLGEAGFLPEGASCPITLGAGLDPGPALLGLRPEGLDVDPALPRLDEVVLDVVERMGHETLVYFRLFGQPCVARLAPEADVAAGRTVTLGLKPDGWHMFAADGEQRRLQAAS
jgi:ABC-type sugar transport system ATPase subunit